jgi:hypothetical protein
MTQPLDIDNFNGGVTDFYVGAPPNKAKTCDNLVINKYSDTIGKLITRPGSVINDVTYYQVPAGNQRVGYIKVFENTALFGSANNLYYVNSGWVTLQGPTPHSLFPSSITTSNYFSSAVWNRHLFIVNDGFSKPQKIYPNASNVLTLRTAGLPALASSPTVTRGGAGANSYIYAFIYYYTYTVDTRIFEDRGAVTEVTLSAAAAPDALTVAITAIPAISNGTDDNYDTASANLKVEIYRTINNGTDFYRVGTVNNGTTSFNDNVSDATLVNNISLYTSGGVVENDTPPLCKYILVVGDIGYYAHIKEGSEIIKNRLRQSIPGDVDSVPGSFFVDIDDEIVGLGAAKDIPILLGTKTAYRVDGQFDELGNGGMTARKISDSCSCISGQSVVQTLIGVFWAGKDGFYFSDGFNVIQISKGLRNTYKQLVEAVSDQKKIQGKYDPINNRIWWGVNKDSTDNDMCFILDLNWGLSDDMPFTTASNGGDFSPTSLEFDGTTMYRGDSRGYIFRHTDTALSDPLVDTSVPPSGWGLAAIIFDYISAAINFGTNYSRKWAPRIVVAAKTDTNLSLQVQSINDDGRSILNLKPIRYRGGTLWGDSDVRWGDPTLVWNQAGSLIDQLRFPAKSLRFSYKQIRLTNAFVAVISSDLIGTVTTDATAKTVTLDGSFTWPDIIVGYVIAFSTDDYVKEFEVTDRNSDTVLTLSDTGNEMSNSVGIEMVVRGFPKNEILDLTGYTIHYTQFGLTQKSFSSSETGEVGS